MPITKAIFSYGDTIYNPFGCEMTKSLFAHEHVHYRRQNGNPSGWWEQYLASARFRLDEEIPAHRAEYLAFLEWASRHDRRRALTLMAERLSGPLYGRMISVSEAKNLISGGRP